MTKEELQGYTLEYYVTVGLKSNMANKIKSLHLKLSIPAKWISISQMDFNRSQQNGVMLQNLSQTILIDQFQIHFGLYLKLSLSAKSLLWISVFVHTEITTVINYHYIKNFTLKFNLKERQKLTDFFPDHCTYFKSLL